MPRVEWCTAGASVWKELQVRALPRSGWAAAGMLLFASAACAVADPPPTGSPAPPSSFLTGVPTEPTKTKARMLPSQGAGVLPTPEKSQRTVRPAAPKKEKAAVPRPDHIVVVILENKAPLQRDRQ